MLSSLGITPRKFSFEPTQTFFRKVRAVQKCYQNNHSRRCHLLQILPALGSRVYDKSCGLLQDWLGRCQNFYAWVSQTNTSAWHSNNFTQGFSIKKHSNSSNSASPYFYIGGFVAVYLSKMAATMVESRFYSFLYMDPMANDLAKIKNRCVYCNMSGKKWVSRNFILIYFFSTRTKHVCTFCAVITWALSWENMSSEISDQVRLKPACAATEASMRLEILVTETRDITLSRQRTMKALIRLRRCSGWSAPLLFAYDKRHDFSWPGSHVCFTSIDFVITYENFVLFSLFEPLSLFVFCFVNVLENLEKKRYSRGRSGHSKHN